MGEKLVVGQVSHLFYICKVNEQEKSDGRDQFC